MHPADKGSFYEDTVVKLRCTFSSYESVART